MEIKVRCQIVLILACFELASVAGMSKSKKINFPLIFFIKLDFISHNYFHLIGVPFFSKLLGI